MSQDKMLFYIISFISLLALISFLASPYFHIHGFNFQGLERLKEAELEKMLEPYYQANILLVNPDEIKNELMNLDYVQNVLIKRRLPDYLEIKIKERRPLARINNNGKYLIFTEDGYILQEGAFRDKVEVPEIRGFGYILKQNQIQYTPALAEIVQALSQVKNDTLQMINLIYLVEGRLRLELKNDVPVYINPVNDLTETFKILQSIISKMKKEDLVAEYIDLSLLKKPVIRMKR